MANFNQDQLKKLFNLAGIEMPQNITSDDISHVLVKIENMLMPCSCSNSNAGSDGDILIVDDLELSIHQLSMVLTKCGFNVHIARSVIEALDKFKKRSYQYILLDLFMPEPEDGFNLLETFKNSEKAKKDDTKIIVISGTDDKKLINKCFAKGADEFISKDPDWHKNILRYVRELESQRKGGASDIVIQFDDQERKIATISVGNLHKESVVLDVEKQIISLVSSGFVNVILDMKKVINIDSKGIGLLVSGYKICSEHGGSFKLCGVAGSINETLSYVYLNNILQSYPDREAAINSFVDNKSKI